MKGNIKPVKWLHPDRKDDNGKQTDTGQTIIINDIPLDEDLILTPEEYRAKYEEKLRSLEELEKDPEPDEAPQGESGKTGAVSSQWISDTVGIDEEEETGKGVILMDIHPAATFDLTPEEYEAQREERLEETKHTNQMPNLKKLWHGMEDY